MIKSSLFIIVFLLLSGCSNKEVFTPKSVDGSIPLTQRFETSIADISGETASLSDGTILSKKGRVNTVFPKDYRFVFKNEYWALALKTGGEIYAINDANVSKTLKLSKTIATVSLKEDLLAVVFADNELALYTFSTGKLLFKQPASQSSVVDMRIANPRFLNDLVLFPTLDGKIVIVNAPSKELVRTIIVSSQQHFNNIIYFNVINDILYAATPTKLYTLSDKELRLDFEIRDMLVNEKGVWVTTKQGEVIAFDHALSLLKRVKFPFAHFLGLVYTDEAVYVAEKESYIIALKHDLSSHKLYEFDLEDGFFYTSDEGFYFDNVYIKLK